jgi:hypothetical protein
MYIFDVRCCGRACRGGNGRGRGVSFFRNSAWHEARTRAAGRLRLTPLKKAAFYS